MGKKEVLVKARTSLISRGSEVLRRYWPERPVDPATMGYSVAGTVVEAGAEAFALQGRHIDQAFGVLLDWCHGA